MCTFFSESNGEGGIWTLAPLLTTYSLSRGAPSASLGTSPNCPCIHDTLLFFVFSYLRYVSQTSQLRHCVLKENKRKSIQFWTSQAERVGFEPTRPLGQTVFKTASLWPLRYLSECAVSATGSILSRVIPYVKTFYKIFSKIFSAIKISSGVVIFIFS